MRGGGMAVSEGTPRHIVLASRSPRRLALAREQGWHVEVVPPDESVERDAPARRSDESVAAYVERLACLKAAAVAPRCRPGTIVACDTLAELDGDALGQPADRDHARRILERLSGRRHHVFSGVCIWRRPELQPVTGRAESVLEMAPLSEELLEWYLDSGLWIGKAGACGFQDARLPLHLVSGSASNVVGLPLELLTEMFGAIDRKLAGREHGTGPDCAHRAD